MDRLTADPRITRLIDRIAHLNPMVGDIGAGMIAQLVSEARAVQCESPAAPITQARVAAAFGKWEWAWNTLKDGVDCPYRVSGETTYAQRLAAGLFKYLEGV